ncbi:MAG: NfeD family protein [Paracoccaceae bacterium]
MEGLWALWWIWLAGALILGIVELLVPGFLFLGFAIGAAAVAILLASGAFFFKLPFLLLIFAALSLIAWLALRRMFLFPKGQVKTFDHDIND